MSMTEPIKTPKRSTKTKAGKKGGVRQQDPYLERELAKYGTPLPSREFILQILAQTGAPMTTAELAAALEIQPDESDVFARRIRAMEADGQIMRNRRDAICVVDKLDLIKGRVIGHADGFGFFVPDDGTADLFLGPKEMNKVLHGDRAMVREVAVDKRGRREGKIVEVLEHVNRVLVGRIYEERGVRFVVAEDARISQDVLLSPGAEGGAQPGQVVMVEIQVQPSKHAQPIGRVVEVLGNYSDPGMEIEIALRKHQLPYQFSEASQAVAKKLPKKVLKKDCEGRVDLRQMPLVTIDGETARDFDDAVYCEKDGKGFRLVVAIADVSHYVRPGDPLDSDAVERGNSVYFPRRVIPMLPEELSNGLCSLNPDVDRLCMVCDMRISARGDIKKYEFYAAVMHSKARLTYTRVAAALSDAKGEEAAKLADLMPHLQQLEQVFRALLQARERRGAIDFESIETVMQFDDHGKIDRIVPVQRNDAHRLIEECMLAANVCASDILQAHEHPALYRIHQGPTPERLANLREFLQEFGLGLSGGEEPTAKDYAKLLAKIKERPDAQLLQTVMLRSLSQAVYSPDNVGHFGLAYESYTHFTSPIRRYPDLLIHRAIKAVLAGTKLDRIDWKGIGQTCSKSERRADEATRDVEAWLKCFYMQDRINETFAGTVSAVVPFGLFVALDEVYVEGLVHISELGKDYYHYEAAKHQLIGERTRKRYRLGDRIKVKLVRVDLETSKIDFVLADDA